MYVKASYTTANNASIVAKHWTTDSYPESGGNPQKYLGQDLVLLRMNMVPVLKKRLKN